MSVDLEAIAQRGRCDVSNLRLALPLLEQGYTPPFLARYRRDELGGLDEPTLWALSAAVQTEQQIAARRAELVESWKQTPLADGAIGHAIKKANSQRMLARLARRLKTESREASSEATLLAVRLMNPIQGDGSDIAAIAPQVEGVSDADAAVAGVDEAIAKRLAGDPRLISAAVRWLAKHAKVHIAEISDPHGQDDHGPEDDAEAHDESPEASLSEPEAATSEEAQGVSDAAVPADAATADASQSESTDSPEPAPVGSDVSDAETTSEPSETVASPTETAAPTVANAETPDTPSAVEPSAPSDPTAADTTPATDASPSDAGDTSTSTSATPETPSDAAPSDAAPAAAETPSESNAPASPKSASKQAPAKASKKQKKISPRQRRRRWLVGVLKPLQGKRLACDKLSSFQVVMLGRALRSQVAQCAFEYDATKLVAELQRVAGGLNRNLEDKFRQVVLEHEANLREAAEAAWWDDLHERASSRLVGITADHLSRQVNRGAVEAKVVMAIDAVGPRTAATAIVSSDGRMLHSEDLPCQLSAAQRTQAVTKMGELIHTHHVDLLVISNGPARRATMIALGDLIGQSPDGSIRWTLADRSGADAYASSGIANDEMRSTPRRFRAAAWLAFSVLQPAQALAKVDPLKLRLSSFQRELSDDAIVGALQDVMTSGASRGGVDVNSAPVSWLQKLPGVSGEMAEAIDQARREKLFDSRDALLELEHWKDAVQSRQAIPFLRVFGGEEVLDGTLIHPEDYPLAKKLASTLEIELPPDTPPGYEPPDYSKPVEPVDPSKLVETTAEAQPAPVEDFSSAGETAAEFVVEETASTSEADAGESAAETESPSETADAEAASTEAAPSETTAETPSEDASTEPNSDEPIASPDAETPAAESPVAETQADEPAAADAAPLDEAPAPQNIPERVLRPKPDRSKTDKCVKEWQIGAKRAHQLVQWLCDPFGDSDSTGSAPAVMQNMPSLNSLKPGEQAIGIVVGVMPFGVFVELAPDCSGLIHVSRVSDSYVEDLHEAVQVGDVVTAWVSGIDEKRRRVALSALSPEREAELEEARRSRPPRGGRGGAQRGQQRGGQQRGGGGRPGGGRPEAGQRSGGPPQRSGRGAASGGGGRGEARRTGGGGRGRDARGGRGRDGGRGGKKREKKPESYRVVGKQEVKPISDAMQKGEEPLRSFGDLMQFFDQSKTEAKPEPPAPKQAAPQDDAPKASHSEQATGSEAESSPPAADPPAPPEATAPPSDGANAAAPETEAKPPQPTSDSESTPPTKDESPSADAPNS